MPQRSHVVLKGLVILARQLQNACNLVVLDGGHLFVVMVFEDSQCSCMTPNAAFVTMVTTPLVVFT